MEVLLKHQYFEQWEAMLGVNIQEEFSAIQKMELEPHSFTFYTSVSVMSSSKIEGEQMDLDSYVKHKVLNIEYLPELTEKPNDLYKAYIFAKDNPLTQENFLHAHHFITAHLLPKFQQGVIRTSEMVVLEHKTGRIQYEAASAAIVKEQYYLLWKEIEILLKSTLTIEEAFYYASFIHLAFVNIHPFSDGNGRISRLLEKWFLAEKLGERAWYIKSEKYYYKYVNNYYRNLARLGLFYEKLEYEKSIPFLLMLPNSLTNFD
ncbi:MAG: Fic family protein [Chitinophagales bacterium]|nr:Fic family protein [Bacteroidota bacterium]